MTHANDIIKQKITFKILPLIAAVFIAVAMSVQSVISYNREKKHIDEQLQFKLQLAEQKLYYESDALADALDQLEEYIQRYIDEPDVIMHKTSEVITRFPDLKSCFVAFAPYFFSQKGKWFEPCSYLSADSVITLQYADQEQDYLDKEWYKGALEADENGFWSPLYFDSEFKEMIYTHSRRLDDKNGNLIAVIGIDFSTSWAERMLSELKPTKNATCLLYSTDSTLISSSGELDFSEKTHMIKASWMSLLEMQLVVAVPKSDIFNNIKIYNYLAFIILLVGISLLGFVVYRYIVSLNEYNRINSEKRVIDNELSIAHKIQMEILRRDFPSNDDFTLAASLLPMKQVGGDLYDFLQRDDSLFFIVGDVSGKGMSAAMFMSATVNLFRSAAGRLSSTKKITEDINRTLSINNQSMMFVTAFIGRLDISTGLLTFCNAGHNPPVQVDKTGAGGAKYLSVVPNIPLGYMSEYRFEEQTIILDKDQTMVLYTDGITEARCADGEMLGKQRWLQIVEQASQTDEPEEQMLTAVLNYVGGEEPSDDITLMCLRKTSERLPAKLVVESRIENLAKMKALLMAVLESKQVDKKKCRDLLLATEEMTVNIITYAYDKEHTGIIVMEVLAQDNQVSVCLIDNGKMFDPTARPQVESADLVSSKQVGGLGISLSKQLTDEMHYQRIDNKNILTLIKYIN